MKKNRIILAFFALAMGLFIIRNSEAAPAVFTTVDTIYLKNGNKIETDKYWIEGDKVKFNTPAGTMTISLKEVKKIVKSEQKPSSPSSSLSRSGVQESPAPIEPKLNVSTEQLGGSAPLEKIEALEKAYRNNPSNKSLKISLINARKIKANSLIQKGKYAEAIEELRPIVAIQPDDAEVRLALGALYLSLGSLSMAETQLREMLILDYSNADAHYLLGEIYYRQEKLTQAIREWKKSLQLKPDEALQAKLDRLTREEAMRANYSTESSARFELKYTGSSNPQLGKAIISVLESMHNQLSRKLDYLPRESIVVILYSNQDFYDATGAPRMVEGLYDGKVKIPIRGLTSVTSQVNSVLMHELTHAFLHGKTKGNCPRWLHEGIAQYMEGKSARAYDYQLGQIVKNSGFSSLPLYPASLSMVEYMIQAYGFSDLLRILKALGDGMSVDMAMKQYLHANFQEFAQEWAEKALHVSP
jgi:tetratricopeptide (TPR) repeat protein